MSLILNDEWKKEYTEYLNEEDDILDEDIDSVLLELNDARESAQKGFSMIREYYEAFSLQEGILLELEPGKSFSEEDMKKEEKQEKQENKNSKTSNDKKPMTMTADNLRDLLSQGFIDSEKDDDRYGVAKITSVESISDMKFPKNIIFFIGQLIKWIRNLVLYFLEKFKNLIRRLVGAQPKELNPESIKLQLKRVKTIETGYISPSGSTKSVGDGKAVNLHFLDKDKIVLAESLADKLGITKPDKPNLKTTPVVVTLDLSRDIQNIKALMDHFLKTFDMSYGSAGEYLYGTDDLEIILNIFKDTIARLKTGNIQQYSFSGGIAIDADGINQQRVKQNLVNTNQNITQLKEIYSKTAAKIVDLTKILNTKEMLMFSEAGANYRLLTSQTFEQIQSILEIIPKYLKKATTLEKNMGKMKNEYTKLISELQGMQRSFASVSDVTFDTIYNRKVIELLNSASWMSDTVSLRLAGIGLFIKELKDVRDALVMVSGMNAPPRGKKFEKFLDYAKRLNTNRKIYKYD